MNFLEIYVPITKGTFLDIVKGNVDVVFNDKYAKAILFELKANLINGNFCDYREVLEISLGLETYSPSEFSAVHNIKVTAFINEDYDSIAIIDLVEKLVNNHPWEHPVMTIWLDDFRMMSKKKPSDFVMELKRRLQIHFK